MFPLAAVILKVFLILALLPSTNRLIDSPTL
jgi:hypothetical protein